MACDHLSETRICNDHGCPIDCNLSAWGGWSTCTKSCGTGSQSRGRSIVVAVAFGGKLCDTQSGTQVCNIHECPVDCILSAWSTYGACTVTCGGGSRSRTRSIAQRALYGGIACGSLHENDLNQCETTPCPTHCEHSAWENWSTCSKSCGSGNTHRTRTITQHPANGGIACQHVNEDMIRHLLLAFVNVNDSTDCVRRGEARLG